MLKDMTPRERLYETQHRIAFYYEKNCGYAFPCDEDGYLLTDEMTEAAIQNYEEALKHPEKYPYCFNKVVEEKLRYTKLATGICKCGHLIQLYDQYLGACECPHCGQWYSLSGQELLPPNKWGWDGTPMEAD